MQRLHLVCARSYENYAFCDSIPVRHVPGGCPDTSTAASQSANSAGGQSAADAPKPAPKAATDPAVPAAKKPKKVWTNDEISPQADQEAFQLWVMPSLIRNLRRRTIPRKLPLVSAAGKRQIANYRDRLHQLRNELESTEKKISDLRNFKAENTSSSGGINMKQRYSMTPLEDQVKQLEERKKQLQSQIDAVEDQARKSGVEPRRPALTTSFFSGIPGMEARSHTR